MTTTQGVKTSSYEIWFRWPSGTTELTYSFNDYVFSSSDAARHARFHDTDTLPENYRDIVREAIDAWERVCGVRFREVADDPDNDIRIGWSADSDGSAGAASYWNYTGSFGRTVKVAVEFNPATTWNNTNFYDTALHELGHAIGIAHSDVYEQVMSGNLPTGPTPYHDQPGRDVLQPDDIAAAQALWGVTPSGPSRTLTGTVDADTLAGGDGNDTIKGGFGNDNISGGPGDDMLAGNGLYWTGYNNPQDNYWSRTFDGTTDRDTIDGGPGNDFINGNAGADDLYGGPGNDTIFGGQNEGAWTPGKTRTNTIHLREGWDRLDGGSGDDVMHGNMGKDELFGGPGNDILRGGQDHDYLAGGTGDDTLYGDLEGDILSPGEGNDVLVLGNDPNSGDGATDAVFLYTADAGRDTIYGFEAGLDRVAINGALSTVAEAEQLGLAVFYIV